LDALGIIAKLAEFRSNWQNPISILKLKEKFRGRAVMTYRKQQGISMLGGLVLLAVVGFFLTAIFKVGPLYLDNSFVKAAVASLQKEDVHGMTDKDIRRKLGAQFDMNNVRDIDRKLIKVTREKTRTLVTLDYEKRVNFMGNVDIVVMFNNSYDSSASGK
jgi:hypothetical protein